jgi:hypothetical protein
MDFNLITILALAFALLVGVVTGITVGRNSSKANLAYDQLKARAERAEQRIREMSSRDKQPEE